MLHIVLTTMITVGILAAFIAWMRSTDEVARRHENLRDWCEEIESEWEWRRQIDELRAAGDAESLEWADYIEHGELGPILTELQRRDRYPADHPFGAVH